MSANVVKVYSKKTEMFEKPLFFFQVILEGGQNSSIVDDLRNDYGKHNYRIYRISLCEDTKLVIDILDQHRRLSERLNIVNLLMYLINSSNIKIDIEQISECIISHKFEDNNSGLLASFIKLSCLNDIFIPIMVNILKDIHVDNSVNYDRVSYETYIGDSWFMPIHLGILYLANDDLSLKDELCNQLKHWQEKSSYMSMIGPHFGLSRDYDDFLIDGGAGGLFGILSFLFYDNDNIRMYFAEELFKIIDETSSRYNVINLLWVLHIIPISDSGERLFNKVKYEISKLNGFSYDDFLCPPFIGIDDVEEWLCQFESRNDEFPQYDKLKQIAENKNKTSKNERIQIACNFLTTENVESLNKIITM